MKNKKKKMAFRPNEIKVLDFDSLGLGEKKCLFALAQVTEKYEENYTFRNYEEGKICLYKDGENWQVYNVSNGEVYDAFCFANAFDACTCVLYNMLFHGLVPTFTRIVHNNIDEEELDNYISQLKERYGVKGKSL